MSYTKVSVFLPCFNTSPAWPFLLIFFWLNLLLSVCLWPFQLSVSKAAHITRPNKLNTCADDDKPIAHEKHSDFVWKSRTYQHNTYTDQPKISFLKLYSSKQHTEFWFTLCLIKQLLNNQYGRFKAFLLNLWQTFYAKMANVFTALMFLQSTLISGVYFPGICCALSSLSDAASRWAHCSWKDVFLSGINHTSDHRRRDRYTRVGPLESVTANTQHGHHCYSVIQHLRSTEPSDP